MFFFILFFFEYIVNFKKLKQMNNTKVEKRTKHIKNNGDIIIDDYKFPKSLWCKMINMIIESFDAVVGDIIVGNGWKQIVKLENAVHVERILNEDRYERDDLLHYNFNTNVNGRVTKESDLSFMKEIQPATIERFSALVMICLHGLGKE